jgi:L,D-peptidoglycan transpeptidase YkuD (ErfK/YbiS/YcfS/YnhG family)
MDSSPRPERRRFLPAPAALATAIAAVLLVTGAIRSADTAAALRHPPAPSVDLPDPLHRAGPKKQKAKPVKIVGPAWTKLLPRDTTQAIRTVRSHEWCGEVYCTRTEAWERRNGVWRIAKGPGRSGQAVFRSQIGARGFAAPGKRRQGDLKSPTGVFGIKVVFSTTENRPTDMPWRRRLPTSVVSSDPGRTYNTWIELPGARSGDRRMMSWGFWIDYNYPRLAIGKGKQPVPGKGSGIFLHTSNVGRPWAPTLACIQIGNPDQAKWIVRWLEPDANPRVVNNR